MGGESTETEARDLQREVTEVVAVKEGRPVDGVVVVGVYARLHRCSLDRQSAAADGE
jgi:hypothetical protein